ncbi:unnamed protein product [Sphagnum balticum]
MTTSVTASITPLMRQYHDIKTRFPDEIVLFQVGDFYEIFYDDAQKAAAALSIVLTQRGTNNGQPIPLCGFPRHAVDTYLIKLIQAGYRVVLCDQLPAHEGSKLIDRTVSQVLTPGTLTDVKLLDEKSALYLCAIAQSAQRYGLLFVEPLTGKATSRSNPATYLGIFDEIRALYASLPESNARGYKVGRFSFNMAEGRCKKCSGNGDITISMHFLPDVTMVCSACKGLRYNAQTLEITYKGKHIADILAMTAQEALVFFDAHHRLKKRLQLLCDVGLDYIQLGQDSTTLSGGEAQRIKLVDELAKRGSKTLYILDEPTTGLHAVDIERLLQVFHRLIEKGNSVVVIEHNIDVLKTVDYIIDMGPEGGDAGGMVVAQGTPEAVAREPKSHTGYYLKRELHL